MLNPSSFSAIPMKRMIFILILLSSFCGCGKKLPSDFPKVYPITVTVTDGSTPLSEVKVTFCPLATGSAYASSGSTDAAGITRISTAQGNVAIDGIPEGEYIVTVQDIIEIKDDVTPEQQVTMSVPELNELTKKRQKALDDYPRKVPAILNKTGKIEKRSPIRFTAKAASNELTIDVAEYKNKK